MTRTEVAALLALVLLAALFRGELLGVRSLWFDEGYSLFVAGLGPGRILEFLRYNDAHPPAYYLLLAGWMRAVGTDLGLLRLPSFAAGLMCVVLAWVVARRWCNSWAAALAGALVAVNPFQVYASNELRMYALLGLVVALAVLVLDQAVATDRRGWWAAYGVLVAAAAYVSYFAALAVVPQVAWVLATRGLGGLRRLVLALVVAGALYAPWLPYLPGILARNPQQWVIRPVIDGKELVPYVLSVLTAHAYGGYLAETATYHRTSLLVFPYLPPLLPFTVAWLVGGLTLARGRAGQVLAVWLGGVSLAVVASAVAGRQMAYPRNLLFLQPLAAVVAAAGAAEAVRRVASRAGVAVAGGLAVSMVALSFAGLQNLQSGHQEFDAYRFDRAARHVDTRLRGGDLVVYFPAGVEHAFGYYLTRPVRAVSLALPVGRWSEAEVTRLAGRLEPFLRARTGGRVWVVTSLPQPWSPLVRPVRRKLEQSGFEMVEARDFLGVQVLLYRPR